jgi:hypothetical protein
MISPYADPNSSWQNTKEITGTPRSSARLFDIWAIEDEAYPRFCRCQRVAILEVVAAAVKFNM